MANHLQTLLSLWHPRRDETQWVLGTVIDTQGSSYRKAGAMMLFNEQGEFFGLLSGGCLEKALLADVKKVIAYNKAQTVEFDSTGDTDVAWQLGLGCGGKVRILLQPVHKKNNYQHLLSVHHALHQRKAMRYCVQTQGSAIDAADNFIEQAADGATCGAGVLKLSLQSLRHLMIFGGGVDAVPVAHMAKNLGWLITLVDHRVSYAQPQHFSPADHILRHAALHPAVTDALQSTDAALVMTHNVQLDADALRALLPSTVRYIGLLGPTHRKKRVLIKAGLADDPRIYGPMGLALGGELPESIALATLAQCHQILETQYQSSAQFDYDLSERVERR